jgi:hypothetical protein
MRRLLGIVIGTVAAIAIIAALAWIGNRLYPLSLEIDSADPASLAAVVGDQPVAAKLLRVATWFLAALGGAWLALRICDWRWSGWIVAAGVLGLAIVDVTSLPHPLWMEACAILLPLLGGLLAARLHRKPYPGEPLLG